MDTTRRHALKTGGGVTLLTLLAAAGWLKPGDAAARRLEQGRIRDASRWTRR